MSRSRLVRAEPVTKEALEQAQRDFDKNYKPLLRIMEDWRRWPLKKEGFR